MAGFTEFYDYTDKTYYQLLQHSVKVYKWKLELLDYQDAVFKEIVVDLDSSNSGSINVSQEQGTCRSCSFTFTNHDQRYSIIENNPFWDRRRFKLYIGIVGEGRIYWFSKGVYITQQATVDYHTVTIQAVDKFGLLDGTLNVSPTFLKTTFKEGAKIGNVVREILLQDIGNGMVLDAVEPIIDPDIAVMKLYHDFEMSVGTYYGEFFQELMSGYGCDIYYDNLGRLIVQRKFNDDLPYWYYHLGASYTFSDKKIHFQEPSTSYDFDGANYITVEADDDSNVNASYTLANHNPRSPVCIEKVGYKAYDNGNVVYISMGDNSIDTPERKCREYAEYTLLQHTCNTITKNFSCPIIPHLDTRLSIIVSDVSTTDDGVLYLVTGLSIPFGVANDMTVTCTNIQWLQTDVESTSLTSEKNSPALTKYNITYDGIVRNADGTVRTIPDGEYSGGDMVQLAISDADNIYKVPGSTVTIDLGYFNGTNFFFGWRDTRKGILHRPNSYYSMPNQDVSMQPEWEEQQKAEFTFLTSFPAGSYNVDSLYEDNENTPEILVGSSGIYQRPADSVGGSYTITKGASGYQYTFIYPNSYHVEIDKSRDNSVEKSYATKIDLSGLTNASSMIMPEVEGTKESWIRNMSLLEEFKFPPNLQGVESDDLLRNCPKLKSVTFPQTNCVIVDFYFLRSSGDISDPAEEFTIPSNIRIVAPYGLLDDCNIGKNLTLACTQILPDGTTPYVFVVPEVVEELHLTGTMKFSKVNTSYADNFELLEIGSNVELTDMNGFGSGADYSIILKSRYVNTLSGAFDSFAGDSLEIDCSNLSTISSCFYAYPLSQLDVPSTVTAISSSYTACVNVSELNIESARTITGSFNSGTIVDVDISSTSLTQIASSFNGVSGTTSIKLPVGSYSIDGSFNGVGAYGCSLKIDGATAINSSFQSFGGSSINITSTTLTSMTGSFKSMGYITTLTTPNSVQSITDCYSGSAIQTLTLGTNCQTLESIGTLNALTTLNLNDALTTISASFNGSSALSTINFQETVTPGVRFTSIRNSFNGVGGLRSIYIKKSAVEINSSFVGCSNLALVKGVYATTITGGSFSYCNISSMDEMSVVLATNYAFSNNAFVDLDITGFRQITNGAFGNNPVENLTVGSAITDLWFTSATFKNTLLTITATSTTHVGVASYYSLNDNILYKHTEQNESIAVVIPTGLTELHLVCNELGHQSILNSSLTELDLSNTLTTIHSDSIDANITIGTLTIWNPSLDMTNIPYANITKVKGYAGSTAETFAQAHNITFEAIT